jgi:UDP-3-O-[3-hydroxymyristoyl] glucosamine N-acyltransferase
MSSALSAAHRSHPLAEIAVLLGVSLPSETDGAIEIHEVRSPAEAAAGSISFLRERGSLSDKIFSADALLVASDLRSRLETFAGKTGEVLPPLLFSDKPREHFCRLLEIFNPWEDFDARNFRDSPTEGNVVVGENCLLGPGVILKRGVCLGGGVKLLGNNFIGRDVQIGENSVLFPGTCVMAGCRIGRGVRIHANTVIGSDGFGYEETDCGLLKVPQIGTVDIGDETEIGSSVTIDRATLGKTCIGRGVKVDNQVQIAHNVSIGDYSIIVSQVGIAGSSRIGRGVIIAGQAGIADHCIIEDGVRIGGGSAVYSGKKIPAGQTVHGIPVMPYRQAMQVLSLTRRLPELFKKNT